ncbi:hypothetical protein LTR84_012470 [Exophiala bonariae]|uniref:Uncharacterized protein n=1 Tax=Exophiala bonariae TaxID=1690606 RepID=A0AAV9NED1_9EURO|nr:hypothetical protein LTR84_012470 [Exophiala bonariae]
MATQPVEEGSPKRVRESPQQEFTLSLDEQLMLCQKLQYQEAKDSQISISQGYRPQIPKKPQTCVARNDEGS